MELNMTTTLGYPGVHKLGSFMLLNSGYGDT